MKTTILLPAFLIFYLLGNPLLPAQNPNWEQYEQADALSSFDQRFREGISAIAASDVRAALAHFDEAKADAAGRKDKDLKRKARDAQRRVKSFYTPYFEQLAQGRAAFAEQDWKAAQLAFETGQALVEKHLRESFPQFAPVDEQLSVQVQQELNRATQQRQYLVQERLRRAEQLFHNGDYEPALQEVQAARSLLIEEREQPQFDRLMQLERQSQYNQYFSQGDEAFRQQQHEQALQAYEAAKKLQATPEVEQRIEELKGRLHYQLLQEGQDAFFNGQYEAAAQTLEEAAGYQDSDYLQRIRENAYSTLREHGQSALDQGDQEASTRFFGLASRFIENEAIRSDIQRAKAYGKYEKYLKKGLLALEDGKLKRARRRFAKAGKYQSTPVVEENLEAIDQYQVQLSKGKQLMKTDPSQAWQSFRDAQQLFDTKEIRAYLNEAREAAGGVVGTGSGEVFYK